MQIVSLFSGAGGLDLGLIQAGHEVVWANDFDPDAVATYRLNIGPEIVLGDICDIPSSRIPGCDVIVGGLADAGWTVVRLWECVHAFIKFVGRGRKAFARSNGPRNAEQDVEAVE